MIRCMRSLGADCRVFKACSGSIGSHGCALDSRLGMVMRRNRAKVPVSKAKHTPAGLCRQNVNDKKPQLMRGLTLELFESRAHTLYTMKVYASSVAVPQNHTKRHPTNTPSPESRSWVIGPTLHNQPRAVDQRISAKRVKIREALGA
jgi:hypothetical protein